MDLSRVPNERKLYLCRWYFIAGFAALPFVWAINTCWFFNDAFRKPPFDEQKRIRNFVIYSAIGSLIWIIGITLWVVIFQTNRTSWGQLGDDLSFIIPLGSL